MGCRGCGLLEPVGCGCLGCLGCVCRVAGLEPLGCVCSASPGCGCGCYSRCSRLCLILSPTTWGSYLASHFLYLSSGVVFTWRRGAYVICLSAGGELTEGGEVGWGGTYLGWGGSVMRYEFLRIGGDPELLCSSRKMGCSCLSSVEGPTCL